MADNDDNLFGMLCHLLGIFTGFLGPLIIWLIKKDESSYVDHHGKQALNFQFTLMIAYVVAWILTFVIIGFLILPVLFILSLIFGIIATVEANKGELYEYPFAIRFIK